MLRSQFSTLSDLQEVQALSNFPSRSYNGTTTMMQRMSQEHGLVNANADSISPSTYPPLLLQKENRARFMVRLSIVLQRLQQLEGQTTTIGQVISKKVKDMVQYATQRNRVGDPRFTPLVDTIESDLENLLGYEEWFSVCLEAQQRSRIRKLRNMIMASTGVSANKSPMKSKVVRKGRSTPPRTFQFQASFFPDCYHL